MDEPLLFSLHFLITPIPFAGIFQGQESFLPTFVNALYCAKEIFQASCSGSWIATFYLGLSLYSINWKLSPKEGGLARTLYILPPGADRLLNKLNLFLLVYCLQCQLPEKLLIVYALRKASGLQGGIGYVIISFSEVKVSCFYYISDDQAVPLIFLRVVRLWINHYNCYSNPIKAVVEWNA